MAFTIEEFDAANERAQQRLRDEPHIVEARYDLDLGRVVLELSSGGWFAFRPEDAQGLEGATTEQLQEIEITPSTFGIDFPQLDAQFDVTALMQGHFGSRKWMADRYNATSASLRNQAKTAARVRLTRQLSHATRK